MFALMYYQWNYEPCCVRPSKMGGSLWRVLTKRCPLEKGMVNHFSILAFRTSWTVWKGKKIRHWKELPSLVDTQCTTGEEWINTSRKNEEDEPKWKQCPVVGVIGDGSKVQCCKEQYCIGTWNVRSMNQGTFSSVRFSSVTQSCPTLLPHESQHARPPYPSSTPGVHTDSCP